MQRTRSSCSDPGWSRPEPGARIVALRDHDARYTALKAGYHGGATLAELTIPLLALLPFGAEPPAGWRELGDPAPVWWEESTEGAVEVAAEAAPTRDAAAARPQGKQPKKSAPVPEGVIGLFGEEEVAPPAPQAPAEPAHQATADLADAAATAPASTADPATGLVERLLATELYQAQLGLLARPPRDKTILPRH